MLSVIGGTGVYAFEGLEVTTSHDIDTPFGRPSAPVTEGRLDGTPLLFLPRHGQGHALMPHEVNYRANLWALKSLGATMVVGVSAVGSLRLAIAPGDLSVPDQYFDFVKGPRERSFFGGGLVAHVSTAEPTCARLTAALAAAGDRVGAPVHTGKTYGCVDGPRLGTRAESAFLRGAAGCDLVGMTNVPEVFLAREAQLCYCTLTIATDYDCWLDDPEQHVSVAQVIARYGASLEKARRVIGAMIREGVPDPAGCGCRGALASALLTPEEALTPEQRALLEVLRR